MSRKSRRWVEAFKTLLIVLLSLSALALLYMSPLVQGSGLSTLVQGNLTADGGSTVSSSGLTTAAIPARMAVGSTMGLYGVQYDQGSVDTLFDLAGPLLGEALSAARSPSTLSQRQWQQLLSGTCVYFDFTAPIPLSALCSWLKEGASNSNLTASARLVLLAQEADGTLSLSFYLEEERSYVRFETGLDGELHLAPILNSVTPNNAFFAFEDGSLPDIVSDHTLFTSEELSPVIYASTTPSLLSDSALTSQLLSALSFAEQNRATISEGVLYVDGEDTLRLSSDGYVEYTSSNPGKFSAAEGLSGAVEAAWALAERALSPLCGEARLYLMSAVASEEEDNTYTITFGYLLNGSVVNLSGQGWAARFHVQNGCIPDFSLCVRSYTATEQTKLLLPADKAAAALTALTDTSKELVIQYQDNGGATAQPGWMGR